MSLMMTGTDSRGSMPTMGTGAFSALSAMQKTNGRVCSLSATLPPMDRPDYRVGVPKRGNYTLLLDNGHGAYAPSESPVFRAVKKECDGQPFSINLPLTAYGTAILRFS